MNKFLTLLSILISLNVASGQNWCDSTFAICDSVFIDSVFFSESATTGNRIHIDIKSNHKQLYAPSFYLCADNEDINFVSNKQDFTSLHGPNNFLMYYEFSNFEIVGDSLKGKIVADNSLNEFSNCMVPFDIAVNSMPMSLENPHKTNIEVFPNPVSEYLFFNMANSHYNVETIYVLDLSGEISHPKYKSGIIDLREYFPGAYIVIFKLPNNSIVSKKIVLK